MKILCLLLLPSVQQFLDPQEVQSCLRPAERTQFMLCSIIKLNTEPNWVLHFTGSHTDNPSHLQVLGFQINLFLLSVPGLLERH